MGIKTKIGMGMAFTGCAGAAFWVITMFALWSYDKFDWSIDNKPEVHAFINKVLGYEGTVKDWEAKPANKFDKGGLTNRGIIYPTYVSLAPIILKEPKPDSAKHRALTAKDARKFWMYFYHDIYGELFHYKGIALHVTDLCWGSGKYSGILILQQAINRIDSGAVKEDGQIGVNTINAANVCDPVHLNNSLKIVRMNFLANIQKRDKTQGVFKNGWNRKTKEIFTFCDSIITLQIQNEKTDSTQFGCLTPVGVGVPQLKIHPTYRLRESTKVSYSGSISAPRYTHIFSGHNPEIDSSANRISDCNQNRYTDSHRFSEQNKGSILLCTRHLDTLQSHLSRQRKGKHSNHPNQSTGSTCAIYQRTKRAKFTYQNFNRFVDSWIIDDDSLCLFYRTFYLNS